MLLAANIVADAVGESHGWDGRTPGERSVGDVLGVVLAVVAPPTLQPCAGACHTACVLRTQEPMASGGGKTGSAHCTVCTAAESAQWHVDVQRRLYDALRRWQL